MADLILVEVPIDSGVFLTVKEHIVLGDSILGDKKLVVIQKK